MNILKVWISGFFLALALAPCAASAMGIELSVGVWNQKPNGDISYKAQTGLDNLSIRDNLKYSDDTKIFGRVKIDTPLLFPSVYLMATPMEFKNTGSKGTIFHFGNATIAANTPFTSELKLDHYDVGLFYGIPLLKTATVGILNVDLGLDARIIDFKARVTGTDSTSITLQTVSESKTAIIPLPMLYVGAQFKPFKWLAVEGEARGVLYDKNHYYDLIGRVKIKPFGPAFVAAGYRYEKVKIDRNDVKAEAEFDGPFGEIGVEF